MRYFESDVGDQAREQLQKLRDKIEYKVESVVRSGEIVRSARREALEWQPDLIVIGREVLGETFGRLRTETYGIIRESPCPVLSV